MRKEPATRRNSPPAARRSLAAHVPVRKASKPPPHISSSGNSSTQSNSSKEVDALIDSVIKGGGEPGIKSSKAQETIDSASRHSGRTEYPRSRFVDDEAEEASQVEPSERTEVCSALTSDFRPGNLVATGKRRGNQSTIEDASRPRKRSIASSPPSVGLVAPLRSLPIRDHQDSHRPASTRRPPTPSDVFTLGAATSSRQREGLAQRRAQGKLPLARHLAHRPRIPGSSSLGGPVNPPTTGVTAATVTSSRTEEDIGRICLTKLKVSEDKRRKAEKRKKKKASFHCKVCDFETSSKNQYTEHTAGSKHRNAVIRAANPSDPSRWTNQLQCDCGVRVGSEVDLRLHLASRKHRRNIAHQATK